jgi:hypothetical protein
MLSIVADPHPGRRSAFCDGIRRRDMLRIGSLTLGGLSLPQLLKAEQEAGIRSSHKAVIMIYMCGAPAHQDMYDMKMDAPAEIRGEFRPISTNGPGLQMERGRPGPGFNTRVCGGDRAESAGGGKRPGRRQRLCRRQPQLLVRRQRRRRPQCPTAGHRRWWSGREP